MAIKESKDLTSLSLDKLIENLKVHEMIIKKDSKIVKAKGERRFIALKAKKESRDEESSTSESKDEDYAIVILDFDLFSEQEEYSEEEVTETMAETMEQYMSKTRANYGSGVARPKIEDIDNFELKGQFLKELRTNTFSDSDHEDANEHIEKVLEIVDLFHIPNITIDQVMLRAFPMSLNGAEVVLFYNGLDVPTRQILDSKGAISSKIAADTKVAIKEIAEYSQKWHNGTSRTRSTKTSDGLAAIQAQLNNLGR
nr:transposase, Ptta/En/Spm, transposase, Tnp1/En/Spm-like protein [Tanacetum cinerariifolium]